MKIKFLQPFTLIDYPGKLACTIFLFGCNFRCGFCYNPELVLKESTEDLDPSDILNFLEKRKTQLEGICITGGEPLLSLDEDFLVKIKQKGYSIKLDTNGSFPDRLAKLIEKDLVDYIAMDIKGRKEDYQLITNCETNMDNIERSIALISNFNHYEFRTTVVPRFHNDLTILEQIKWICSITNKKIKRFCLQGFKNNGKFVNESFLIEKDVDGEGLASLKEKLLKTGLVEEVLVRV